MFPASLAFTVVIAASPNGDDEYFSVRSMPMPPADSRPEQSRSTCVSDHSLCYDATTRRIVYKPARALMPDIPGLRRENISVKRDRIILKYSF